MVEMQRALRSRVFARIDEHDLVKLTQRLIELRSVNPPGEEKAISQFLEDEMKARGLKVDVLDTGGGRKNVLGWVRGSRSRPALLLNGHSDVVTPGDVSKWKSDPFKPVVRDGKVYGRGAADMKGGLAAMIVAAAALVEDAREMPGSVAVLATVDEEVRKIGARRFVETGGIRSFDAAVIGEPTDLAVATAQKGMVWVRLETGGKMAHASQAHLGVNAVHLMSDLTTAIRKELRIRRHKLFGRTDVNVTVMEGGYKVNVIPDTCRAQIDIRIVPGQTCRQIRDQIRDIVTKKSEADPTLRVQWELFEALEPTEVPAESPVVRALATAYKQIEGERPKRWGFPATTDGSVFVAEASLPILLFGPGRLSEAHSIDEFVETSQLVDASKIYALTALNFVDL
jgi:succinyl-diaminopimelate desuccinylase